MKPSRAWDALQRYWAAYSGSPAIIRYLRTKGVGIGEGCFVQTLKIANEHFLVKMGNHVAVAAGVQFITHDGAASWFFREDLQAGVFGTITLGNHVFVGMNSILLPNTSIGNNCLIGAGSVVRGNFPDNSVIMGNPARVIMKMNAQKLLYKMSPGLCATLQLNMPDTVRILKKHFSAQLNHKPSDNLV